MRVISCNAASYGPYPSRIWDHLPSLGVKHVELPLPDDPESVKSKLEQADMKVSSLMLPREVVEWDAQKTERAFKTIAQLGAKIAFLSLHEKSDQIIKKMRELGEIAGANGVVIAIETHPELAHNAEIALQTLEAIHSPHVRYNFDTANIYYYNKSADACEELTKAMPAVVSLHLKDTEGNYRDFNFPPLGDGIVDFPRIFTILDEAGFDGPCAMELEGVEGESPTESQVLERVEASVQYLERIGAL